MNEILIILLTLGIVVIKATWIHTEIRFAKERVNFEMIKTNAVEAIIIILQILAAVYTPIAQTQFSWLITISGVCMYLAGMALALWSRQTMSASWGVPGVHDKQKQSKLVTSGPFGISRNPIYVGFLMIYFGYAIAIQSWLVILRIPLAIYFYNSAKREEKELEKLFGKEYVEYKKRTPRFL